MSKITTAEELQTELRAIWAMTEKDNPSREKVATALHGLANKLASTNITGAQEMVLTRRPLAATDWAKICSEAERFRDAVQASLRIKVVITITITESTITVTITISW